jgi:hypothetical protein
MVSYTGAIHRGHTQGPYTRAIYTGQRTIVSRTSCPKRCVAPSLARRMLAVIRASLMCAGRHRVPLASKHQQMGQASHPHPAEFAPSATPTWEGLR